MSPAVTSTPQMPRILVSGASVAGPALAYWLVRAGCKVTVVERATSLRTEGQGIDIRDAARDVVKRMGIFDRMIEASSHEEGIEVIGSNDSCIAKFAVDLESGNGDSFTCDIEILRGELAKILFDVTKNDVEYIFGDMVESLEETGKEIFVKFANGTPDATFDLVVAADGIGSKIRRMTFGKDIANVNFRSLNAYISYFSIPKGKTDTMWSQCHWVKGGRAMVMRPDNVGRTRVFLCVTAYDKSDSRILRLRKASQNSVAAQKAVLQEIFEDAGWESARLLEGMHTSDDFYSQDVAQIRLDRWSSSRVVLVGDAGYAPSPFTGMGTSIAFIGAYVLAGEISRNPGNISAALESYEQVMRPYVESIQKLPPGIPWIVNPQSVLGVKVFESLIWIFGIIAGTRLVGWFFKVWAYIPIKWDYDFKLPEYDAFKQ